MLNLDSNIDIAPFFKWWGKQLSFLLPKKLMEAMQRGNNLLVIEIQETVAVVHYVSREQTIHIGEFELNELGKKELHDIIAQQPQYQEAKTVLRIPKHQSVIQTVFLPVATETSLHQVMTYELDKYTPFTQDQVYFDVVKVKQALSENQSMLQLKLVLVKKVTLDALYEKCVLLGIKPFYVDSDGLALSPGNSKAYNLLPKSLAQKEKKTPFFIMLGSILFTFILVVAVIVLPLQVANQALQEAKQETRKLKQIALKIEESKKVTDHLFSVTQQLVAKKKAEPVIVAVLNAVSKELKDDTWVSRLNYFNNTLQLTGQSSNASNLISILESIQQLKDVKFISPVTKDHRTGLGYFTISAEVTTKQSNDKTK